MGGVGVVSDERLRFWAPRLLAPLAFFAAATALVLIVHNSLRAEPANPREAGGPPRVAVTGTDGRTGTAPAQGKKKQQQKKRFYRVRVGDTLDAIAIRFDTTVDALLRLNPRVDPNALVPGQRIRVR